MLTQICQYLRNWFCHGAEERQVEKLKSKCIDLIKEIVIYHLDLTLLFRLQNMLQNIMVS